MTSTVEIIINASAGTSGKQTARSLLADIFAGSGVSANISLARSGKEIESLANQAAAGGAQTIVAAGGDGTINSIASKLVNTDKVLGVLPMGTLNHFAKDLRIPLDLEAAARTILAGHAIKIDVGEVNDHIFLNNSSLGLYPSIVHQRVKVQKLGHGKWPAFLWAAVTVLRRYPFLQSRLIVDDAEFNTLTPFVFVGNNVYEMESFNIGTRTHLDQGVLSVYVTHRTGRAGLLRLAVRALFRRLQEADDFMALTTRELTVDTRRKRPVRVATDGEIALMQGPLHYRVLAGALNVLVPESSEGAA